MRIGELASRTGVSARMLRYYEEAGLLQPARMASGYREYTDADAMAVSLIQTLSAAGLRLESIRVVLPCAEGAGGDIRPCPLVRPALEREFARIVRKIEALEESREVLGEYLRRLDDTQTQKL